MTLIIVAVLLIGGGLMVINNPNAIPGVKLEINTPKPVVVTSRADGSKSGLLKARTTVWATVQNQGGDGNIVVTFHVYQNGNDYDRSKQIYLLANESQDLEVQATAKRLRKGVPLLVGNIGPATFGQDDNALLLIDAQGTLEMPRNSKQALARMLVLDIAKRLPPRALI